MSIKSETFEQLAESEMDEAIKDLKERKKYILAKEETFKALETLMFYHEVYYSISQKVAPGLYTHPAILTKGVLNVLREEIEKIEDIRISFKPDFDL